MVWCLKRCSLHVYDWPALLRTASAVSGDVSFSEFDPLICCVWSCTSPDGLFTESLAVPSSESTSVDDSDHHDVSDGGDDGDPEPDGVAGHGLWLLLLARCWRCRRCCVHAGRGVKERVLRAAVVQRRCVHERAAAHHRKLKHSSAGHWLWCTGVCVWTGP